jgi:hypothetical protein
MVKEKAMFALVEECHAKDGKGVHFTVASTLIIEVPSQVSDQLSDDEPTLRVLTNKPEATFHWPPECLWPFMDHGSDSET